jgi:hypothetical protein
MEHHRHVRSNWSVRRNARTQAALLNSAKSCHNRVPFTIVSNLRTGLQSNLYVIVLYTLLQSISFRITIKLI